MKFRQTTTIVSLLLILIVQSESVLLVPVDPEISRSIDREILLVLGEKRLDPICDRHAHIRDLSVKAHELPVLSHEKMLRSEALTSSAIR